MLLNLIQFAIYLSLLMLGSHVLVKGNIVLASLLKTKVFFMSMILLGIGSSAPELFVTITSHLQQETDIAIGNILGSNIFNILIVGALAFLSTKYISNALSMCKSIFFLLIMTLITGGLLWNYTLSWWKGVLLLVMFSFFLINSKESEEPLEESTPARALPLIVLFVAGFGLLFFGSKGVISSSIEIGNHLGLSKRLVGIFLISIGTSLPELAIAIMSLIKRKSDIALGSIIGSNAFNTFFIPSIASFISPLMISPILIKIDSLVVVLVTSLFLVSVYLFNKIPKAIFISLFLMSYLSYAYFILWNRI